MSILNRFSFCKSKSRWWRRRWRWWLCDSGNFSIHL